MDLHGFLRTRRSIRRFTPKPIPRPAIERILETATFAPSAHNRQPWRFAVVTHADAKARLAHRMAAAFRRDLEADEIAPAEIEARIEKSRTRINSAPVIILLCMDLSEMDIYPDPRRRVAERTMAVQSTANAGLQLLLAAHAEGLGGVWSCSPLFAAREVTEALALPPSWEPQAMFLIGSSAEEPRLRARKPVHTISIFR